MLLLIVRLPGYAYVPSRAQSLASFVMPMFNGGPRIVSTPALRRYCCTWNIWAVAFIASVPSGRCALCSSIAPIGNRTMSVFFTAASNSGKVMSSIVGYLTFLAEEGHFVRLALHAGMPRQPSGSEQNRGDGSKSHCWLFGDSQKGGKDVQIVELHW